MLKYALKRILLMFPTLLAVAIIVFLVLRVVPGDIVALKLTAEGGEVTLDVSNDLLRRQVTLIGSWTFSKHGQADCANFVTEKKIDVDKLFTHSWSLDQADEAYKLFDLQSDGKGVFIP